MRESNSVYALVIEGSKYLKNRCIDTPMLDSRLFMMKTLNFTKTELFTRESYVLSEAEKRRYMDMIIKRGDNIPTQYILGECEFMSLNFYVDKNVLIPRPDTETLVETVLNTAERTGEISTVLDIGTGSGCIPVSLVKYGIKKATAVDISDSALAVAEKNAERNGAAENITFTLLDILKCEGLLPLGRFDAIVSNPPYIESGVIASLMKEVKDNEPVTALDGGYDGLVFYRKITALAADHLSTGKFLFYEIGYNQALAVKGILRDYGFKNIRVVKDLSGLDRVVYGQR